MVMIRRIKNKEEADNNIFWTTMSDLMLGLAIIFIAMFVLAMTGFNQNDIKQHQDKVEMSQKIEKELQNANINAKVNSDTGTVEIPSGALFGVNSYVLTPEGKKLLDEFTPIYINTIFGSENLSDDIENILIQGFTDSQSFAGVSSKDEQFLRNMELSLKRANAVAEYMLINTNYNKKYSESFRTKMIVEGNSYNKPILKNGQEDYDKSRRVELKIKVKDSGISSLFGFGK